MENSKKLLLIIIGVIIGVILFDSIQAMFFNNKPIFSSPKGSMYTRNRGFLVDNYVCSNGVEKTVFKWKKDVCSNEIVYVELSKESSVLFFNNDVSLRVKEGTLFESSLIYVLENNSNFSIAYDNEAWLEKMQDGKWYSLKIQSQEELGMLLLPYSKLESRDSIEKVITFAIYGKLTVGKYRLVKKIKLVKENDNMEDFYVAAEFTID